MNELLYKKIDNLIRDKMHKLNNKIRKDAQEHEDPEMGLLLCMLIVGFAADISNDIKHILEEDIEYA